MKTVFMYGIGGADVNFKVIRYEQIQIDDILESFFGLVQTFKYESNMMRIKHPNIERIFIIDQRRGLAKDYKNAWTKNSIESHAIFKDILEREGLEIT